MLLRHIIPWALALDLFSAGRSIAARMAMMAITTSNSMRVKPRAVVLVIVSDFTTYPPKLREKVTRILGLFALLKRLGIQRAFAFARSRSELVEGRGLPTTKFTISV